MFGRRVMDTFGPTARRAAISETYSLVDRLYLTAQHRVQDMGLRRLLESAARRIEELERAKMR